MIYNILSEVIFYFATQFFINKKCFVYILFRFKMLQNGEGGVESPYLLRDLPKLSHIHQTKGFEVFHSVVNHFVQKSTHFFYIPMLARYILL